MRELHLEAFHIREQRFLIILRVEGQEIFEGMFLAYPRLRQSH